MYSPFVIEWFAGVGGFSASVVNNRSLAVDINTLAKKVYETNFAGTYLCREIETIGLEIPEIRQGDFWWISPPCQPFTRRGNQNDINDRRTRAFHRLIESIERFRPKDIAVENVPGFEHSDCRSLLVARLKRSGYEFLEFEICPTQFGIPNRRRRYYLAASQTDLDESAVGEALTATFEPIDLQHYLDSEQQVAKELYVNREFATQFAKAIDIVNDPRNESGMTKNGNQSKQRATACFASSYGSAAVQSGSYLRTDAGLRRFSPVEILRLLGFPSEFRLPDSLTTRQQWRLLGNSLSLYTVRQFLKTFPGRFELSVPAVSNSNS